MISSYSISSLYLFFFRINFLLRRRFTFVSPCCCRAAALLNAKTNKHDVSFIDCIASILSFFPNISMHIHRTRRRHPYLLPCTFVPQPTWQIQVWFFQIICLLIFQQLHVLVSSPMHIRPNQLGMCQNLVVS